MKKRFFFQIFLLFSCLLIFVSVVAAQEKPQALKFDEFEDAGKVPYYNIEETTLAQRVERFSKQLKKERAARVYIIYYLARITEDFDGRETFYRAQRIKDEIRFKANLEDENFVIIDGGYRDERTFEFWIAPKNAAAPVPTPTLDKSESVACRRIPVSNDTPLNQTEVARFSIQPHNLEGLNEYSLTWRVSGGEIVRRQGTSEIEVKPKDAAKRVTAYVEVGGLPFPCPKVFSATALINEKLYLFTNFKEAYSGETKAIMDAFFIQLHNYATTQGYIIVYGNRGENKRDVEIRIKMVSNYTRARQFDTSRVTIVRGGFRETLSTDLWISFDGSAPTPTPTVNEKFVVVPKLPRKPNPRKK